MPNKAVYSNSLAPYRMSRLWADASSKSSKLIRIARLRRLVQLDTRNSNNNILLFAISMEEATANTLKFLSFFRALSFFCSSSLFCLLNGENRNLEFSQFNQHIACSSNAHLALPQLRWQAIARAAQKWKKNKMTIKISKRNFLSSSLVWFQRCVHMNQNKYENMFEQGVYLRKMWIAQFLCCQNILWKFWEHVLCLYWRIFRHSLHASPRKCFVVCWHDGRIENRYRCRKVDCVSGRMNVWW